MHKDRCNQMALHALELIADGESDVRPDIIAKVALGRLPLGALLALEHKVDHEAEQRASHDDAKRRAIDLRDDMEDIFRMLAFSGSSDAKIDRAIEYLNAALGRFDWVGR